MCGWVNQEIVQNVDMILFTCEALQFSILHRIVAYTPAINSMPYPYITSLQVFQIRHSSQLRSFHIVHQVSLQEIIDLIYIIRDILIKDNLIAKIKKILAWNNKETHLLNDSEYEIFIRRFQFLFRYHFDSQAVGLEYYKDDNYIKQVALMNLYMLYLLTHQNGYDYFFSYLQDYKLYYK
uniref:hypothetical protein n=1 Tax=Chroodactylon ornatum TaxID=139907 RepID=UPI001FCDD4AC|nr:hypothetical protein MW609_pgp048 [Chroodactylon ornatum]UNJ14651.1 hypothetical protein [Chroodactylon ornatum]